MVFSQYESCLRKCHCLTELQLLLLSATLSLKGLKTEGFFVVVVVEQNLNYNFTKYHVLTDRTDRFNTGDYVYVYGMITVNFNTTVYRQISLLR